MNDKVTMKIDSGVYQVKGGQWKMHLLITMTMLGSTYKREHIFPDVFATREEALKAVNSYIDGMAKRTAEDEIWKIV